MARPLTLEQAQKVIREWDIVWVEYKDDKYKDAVVAAIRVDNLGCWMDQNDDYIDIADLDDPEDCPYGKKYRFWNVKPDYLTRKAVKWDD